MVQATVLGQGYQVRDASDGLQSLRRLDTYLRLFALDLLPTNDEDRRRGHKTQIHLFTALRIRADFGDFSRRWDFSDRGHGLERGDNPAFELLFGYLSVTDLAGLIDLRLGRQFHLDPMDFYGFDGLFARVRLPIHLAVEGIWGLRNQTTVAWTAPLFVQEGQEAIGAAPGWRPMVGAALETRDLRWLSLRVAYRTTWHVLSDEERELAGQPAGSAGAVDTIDRVDEKVSAFGQVSLLKGRLVFYGGLRYNLLTDRFDEHQAGVVGRPFRGARLRLEHVREHPDFDGDSIFNIFDTEPFQEVRLTWEQRFTPRLHAYLRATVRLFTGGDETLDEPEIKPDAGGGLGLTYQGRRVAARVDLYWQEGYGGRTLGAFGLWQHTLIRRWLAWEGRATIAHWNDGLSGVPKGVTAGIGLGARARLGDRVALHVLVEDNFGTHNKSDIRVVGLMNVSWCTRGSCPAGEVIP
jgi:hypothetical protein